MGPCSHPGPAVPPSVAGIGANGRFRAMQIALHNKVDLADGDVLTVLDAVCQEVSGEKPDVFRFDAPIDLLEGISPSGHALLDLVIIPYDLPGMTGIDTVCEARDLLPNLRSMLVADTPLHAALAASKSIDEYLVQPVATTAFEEACTRQIAHIAAHHDDSITLNARGGAKRVACSDLMYCETSGHDQVLHLVDGSVFSARYSSQALFDLLSADRRFFKAGSSYIVNLHEVDEARTNKGTVLLSNGMELNVPARLRKGLEEALLSLVKT